MSDHRTSIPGRSKQAEPQPAGDRPRCRDETSRAPWLQALKASSLEKEASLTKQVVQSPGEPLDTQVRAFFEPRFGHDFGRVRIHTDQGANESTDRLHADAYTTGSHVVFGVGRYAPHTQDGRTLLGHELAHVAQQGKGTEAGNQMRLSRPDAPAERAADVAAHRIVAGHPPTLAGIADPGMIYRTVKEDLRKAIAGWGTDEEAIYTRLQHASLDEKKAVLSDPVLMQDLYDDLNRGEWGKVLGLLGASTESRVYAASEGWGTDEEAIYDALRATGVDALKAQIQGSTVLLELRDELSDDELGQALAIIAEKFFREGVKADADIYHALMLFPDAINEALDHFKALGIDLAASVIPNLPRGNNMPAAVVDDVNAHIANDANLSRVEAAFEARWNLNLTARAGAGGTVPGWTVDLIRKVHRALQQVPAGHVVRGAQNTAGISSGEVAAFQLDALKPAQGSWNAASGTIRVGTTFSNVAGLTRHEVGHAMDDFLGATTVGFKQNATNGWSWGALSATWETAMANPWLRKDGSQVPAADQAAIKTILDAYVQTDGSGGLRAGTPAGHAIRTYWNDGVPMIEAAKGLAGKKDDVYTALGSVKKFAGRYYSWSTYYHEFYVYNAVVQDKRLTDYSLYGHPEFFAEMYEAYYAEGPGPKRGDQLKGVANWKQFFDATVHPTVMT
jgi:hypothetical protein